MAEKRLHNPDKKYSVDVIWVLGHMTKMATIPIDGKTPQLQIISFSQTLPSHGHIVLPIQ